MLQLMSPTRTPGLWGFSPYVKPELIATYQPKGRPWHSQKGLTATAPRTKAAIRSRSLDAAAPDH